MKLVSARRARPMEGLTACGDAVVELRDGAWNLFAVIDALGHGPDAEKSAQQAARAIEGAKGKALSQVFDAVHRSLRHPTPSPQGALAGLRGVVMSALLVEDQTVTFAGVGNVELFTPEGVGRPVAMAGTLGAPSYRFRSFELPPLSAGQRWVLASDGIKAREVSALLGKLRRESAEVVADALLSQVTRAHDDASVLVLDVEAA